MPTGTAWLPDAARGMIDERGRTAQALAGGPRPAAEAPARTAAAPTRTAVLPAQTSTARPGAGRRPRRRIAVGAAAVATLALVAAALVVLTRPDDTLSVADAVALVAQVAPAPDDVPDGYVIDEAPGPGPSSARENTRFECSTSADPPTPAEAGILAGSRTQYREDQATLPRSRKVANDQYLDVYYVDAAHRGLLLGEIAGRIDACRTAPPPGIARLDLSAPAVPGADEQVGKAIVGASQVVP